MSFSLAHNRPVEVLHLYFNPSGGIMTLCELATTEKIEVAGILIHDRRVILRALANERFWPVIRTAYLRQALPVVWDRMVRQFMRVVQGPAGLSEGQARDWQDETLQLHDEIADALADTAHVAAQGNRAMACLFESITSQPQKLLERAQQFLFQPALPTESEFLREASHEPLNDAVQALMAKGMGPLIKWARHDNEDEYDNLEDELDQEVKLEKERL